MKKVNTKEYILYSHYEDQCLTSILSERELEEWIQGNFPEGQEFHVTIYELKPTKFSIEQTYKLVK